MKEKAATKLQQFQLGFGYTQSQIMPERYNNQPHPPRRNWSEAWLFFQPAPPKSQTHQEVLTQQTDLGKRSIRYELTSK